MGPIENAELLLLDMYFIVRKNNNFLFSFLPLFPCAVSILTSGRRSVNNARGGSSGDTRADDRMSLLEMESI